MKISIIIPVYYNENNLEPLYKDLNEKVLNKLNFDYEVIMVNDGSLDKSYEKMIELSKINERIKIISLSRNFGAHSAVLCGLENCTGDCAVIKAADLQEPSELILEMLESWKKGNKVVLAVRKGREDGIIQTLCSNTYYWLMQKLALSSMPKGGFDVYLIDRKVINILCELDEKNSALTAQILWSGFRTDKILYTRKERTVGRSKWTLRKKIKLVADTMFGFSTVPITFVTLVGVGSFMIALVWAVCVLIGKINGEIPVEGWTTLFIFNLMSFGIIMLTLGILGGYLWRTFDASRNRPTYIIEEENELNQREEERKA